MLQFCLQEHRPGLYLIIHHQGNLTKKIQTEHTIPDDLLFRLLPYIDKQILPAVASGERENEQGFGTIHLICYCGILVLMVH